MLHQGGYLHHRDAWHGALRDLFREAQARPITSIDPQFPLFALPVPWLPALGDRAGRCDRGLAAAAQQQQRPG
ncbi:MAG: hypothetical protein U0703_04630 [Anaerolineae bacterium]